MDIIETLIYFVAGFLLLFISKIIRDLCTKVDDDQELTSKDNPAFGLATAGYYLRRADYFLRRYL